MAHELPGTISPLSQDTTAPHLPPTTWKDRMKMGRIAMDAPLSGPVCP